ncbi:ribosome biogenesis GTPase Der [Peptoniphilus sp. GNH]|nr:ribosome biogenesis GTPase Der [Clostridiales bacterium KA00134]UHR03113.1 ribosome biogenesis GTPase Der [Peptoniphilus sp. GNH]
MTRPVVCIIGKPNVGKSTLFNKIVGKKISITEDTPGVTRDRINSVASWLGRKFLLVDTGGLDPKDEDIFMTQIKDQADVAIETSDVIIFLTDGLDGVSSIDRDIANILRTYGKKVVLCVNKFDAKAAKDNYYDFFELGLGEPIKIAAEQGMGVGDLLDAVIEKFPIDLQDDDDDDDVRVTFIGKPNVGKSSLINYILKEDRSIVTNIPGTTRDAIDSQFNYKDNKYILVDTAGLRKRKKIDEKIERYSVIRTLTAIERSTVCVLMIDAIEGVSEQDAKIVGYAHDNNKAIIIAVNKWDALTKDDSTMKKFTNEVYKRLPFITYAPIVFISAKTGQRVENLLDLIMTVNANYNHRISTGALNAIIDKAVLLNQPPSDKGKRGKLYFAQQVGTRPPKFVFHVNDKELFHFTYMRYLENQIREAYGFLGTPISIILKNKGD